MEAFVTDLNVLRRNSLVYLWSSPGVLNAIQTFCWMIFFRSMFSDIFNPAGYVLSVILLYAPEPINYLAILAGLIQTILARQDNLLNRIFIGPSEKCHISP
jgi:hypothetical protein